MQLAFGKMDELNAGDPNRETVDGIEVPKELVYARRMTVWLERFEPEASEELRLAARSQHIARWKIPRSDYPEGKAGYKQWRTDLASFHADTAAHILRASGYDEETIERVRALLRKKRLKSDAEVQTLEDVACLVFLDAYFDDFAAKHTDEKVVDILRKTWFKMSERGHQVALQLPLSPRSKELVTKALSPSDV